MRHIYCILLLSLVSCASFNRKPVVTEPFATKQDFDDMQNNMIKQMEATIELVHQDNKATRASVKKAVSECLCPAEMK